MQLLSASLCGPQHDAGPTHGCSSAHVGHCAILSQQMSAGIGELCPGSVLIISTAFLLVFDCRLCEHCFFAQKVRLMPPMHDVEGPLGSRLYTHSRPGVQSAVCSLDPVLEVFFRRTSLLGLLQRMCPCVRPMSSATWTSLLQIPLCIKAAG